jgi:hypothetical protein
MNDVRTFGSWGAAREARFSLENDEPETGVREEVCEREPWNLWVDTPSGAPTLAGRGAEARYCLSGEAEPGSAQRVYLRVDGTWR